MRPSWSATADRLYGLRHLRPSVFPTSPLKMSWTLLRLKARRRWYCYGGQTPIKLARALKDARVPIMGTQPEAIDLAEDRDLRNSHDQRTPATIGGCFYGRGSRRRSSHWLSPKLRSWWSRHGHCLHDSDLITYMSLLHARPSCLSGCLPGDVLSWTLTRSVTPRSAT